MSKTTNHLELVIGSKMTIHFDNGSTLTADAFRTNEAGVYVSDITEIHGEMESLISQEDLIFFPWSKIKFLKYETIERGVVADTPSTPNVPQG